MEEGKYNPVTAEVLSSSIERLAAFFLTYLNRLNRSCLLYTSIPVLGKATEEDRSVADVMAFHSNRLRAEPVSYTHLDVYKRQT